VIGREDLRLGLHSYGILLRLIAINIEYHIGRDSTHQLKSQSHVKGHHINDA